MAWTCTAGSTLLIPSHKRKHHLHFVLTDPQHVQGYRDGSCVLVGVTTIYQGIPFDNTCVLDASCGHSFIEHPSYVLYSRAHHLAESDILARIRTGLYVAKEPASEALLEQVVCGLKNSDHTSMWAFEFSYPY